jgi:DNA-binding MarR family transcriptional regulator
MVDGATRENQDTGIFSASEARAGGFLAVPVRAVRECGSCSQTLAGLLAVLRLDGGKTTYRNREQLAKSAGLPVRTWTRHAAELRRLGLIEQTHHPNQTTQTRITIDPAEWFKDGFLAFPKWLLNERMPWAWRVVYCWCLYRCELAPDGSWCEDSLSAMARALGLTRRSVINAIRGLVGRGLITRDHLTGSTATTRLEPPKKGGEKMARPLVKKWPGPGEKMARPTSDKKLIKKTGQKRPDHELTVGSGPVPRMAHELFKRSQYRGDDGGIFWTVAGLVVAGLVSEFEALDAANGAAECQATNRPGYFRAIIRNHLRRRGVALEDVFWRVRLTPHTPTDPPVPASNRPAFPVRMKRASDV